MKVTIQLFPGGWIGCRIADHYMVILSKAQTLHLDSPARNPLFHMGQCLAVQIHWVVIKFLNTHVQIKTWHQDCNIGQVQNLCLKINKRNLTLLFLFQRPLIVMNKWMQDVENIWESAREYFSCKQNFEVPQVSNFSLWPPMQPSILVP